jgi:hypothetical protein
MGVEVAPAPGVFTSVLIQLGGGTNTDATMPHHFIFDRVYVHGDPTVGGRRGFLLESRDTAVMDSYVSEFKQVSADTQAILSTNGWGPFKIVNNYLEAAGENIMFGGGGTSITGLTPSDIEIRHNHFFKPRQWKVGDPLYQGTPWTIKNLLELKHAQRVVIEGNLFDQNWGGQGQAGFALVFTVRGEGFMTWAPVQDVTVRNNVVRNTGQGIVITGQDNTGPSGGGRRILVQNNLWQIDSGQWGGNGELLLIVQGTEDITFEHNTVDQNGQIIRADGPPHRRFVFRNNLIGHGSYGVTSDKGVGNRTLSTHFPGADFRKNAIWGGNSTWYSNYPDNFWPASVDRVGFVNRAAGDYRLTASSPYRNAGADGKDLGANFEVLTAAMASNTTWR